ncbi:MAG TPA: prolyl oligopeptidase family serine peptidase [Chloroflexota bacterium]
MPLTRARLFELLGTMPGPARLDGQVEARFAVRPQGDQDRYSIVRERVTFQVEPGERVAAYLFVPFRPGIRPGRRPAVLCLHQHAGQFDLGKSEPAGLAGNPEQHYALELARRGYVTLVADHLCFEERRDPALEGAAFERFEFTRRVSLGSSLQAKYSSDAMRALDYLGSREEVDSARIGCVGHSLGGQQTLFLAALDERVRVAVSSCGFASLATIFRDRINHNYAAYVPGLAAEADLGDVLALVAPRPFFVGVGRADRIFPIDGVEATVAAARPAYAAADAASHLGLMIEPGGHAFSEPMRAAAFDFVDRWLKPG